MQQMQSYKGMQPLDFLLTSKIFCNITGGDILHIHSEKIFNFFSFHLVYLYSKGHGRLCKEEEEKNQRNICLSLVSSIN